MNPTICYNPLPPVIVKGGSSSNSEPVEIRGGSKLERYQNLVRYIEKRNLSGGGNGGAELVRVEGCVSSVSTNEVLIMRLLNEIKLVVNDNNKDIEGWDGGEVERLICCMIASDESFAGR